MANTQNQNDLVALLKWYADMGVDDSTAESPIDWMSRANAPPGKGVLQSLHERYENNKVTQSPVTTTRHQLDLDQSAAGQSARLTPLNARTDHRQRSPTLSPEQSLQLALVAARTATTLPELNEALQDFDGCGLKATAKNTCFFRGSENADVAVIGEAPGRDEDLQGRPFVGRAGKLLDLMLASIGLDESNVHITNIVYWRPPGNRTPTPQEAQICRPFLERQMELVDPKIVLLLGGAAAKQIFETTQGIMRQRGKWREINIGSNNRQAIATLHPAYLLRTPAAKRLAWQDLISLKKKLV